MPQVTYPVVLRLLNLDIYQVLSSDMTDLMMDRDNNRLAGFFAACGKNRGHFIAGHLCVALAWRRVDSDF